MSTYKGRSPLPKHRNKSVRVVNLKSIPANRMKLVFLILSLGIVGLTARMAWLQIVQSPTLEARAREFQTYRTKTLGERRSIVDRRGKLVALDEERYRIWAHPRYFHFFGDASDLRRTPLEVARKLSGLLSKSTNELLDLMGEHSSGVKLAEDIDPELAFEIKKLGISGLDLEPYLQRIYPQGSLFANVVGFLNQERVPQAGLEQSLNRILLRKEKSHEFRRGADGTHLPNDLAPGVLSGDDKRLYLTLDSRLQDLALKALSEQVSKWKAKKAVAIVMNVNNGELLALASTPTYDPNSYWKYSPLLFKEWSVQDLFEPGSTFKPINLALALEEGVIQPDGTVEDMGRVNVGGWSIFNHDKRANGVISFPRVLQVSSNVGMVNIMRRVNPSRYWDWLHKLGLDLRPNTDLPGAIAGQLKGKEQFVKQPIEPAAASYGQGFSLTPLKLAQLHALIANGGYLVDPRITTGFQGGNDVGRSIDFNKEPLLSPEVTRVISSWMESVVDQGSGYGVKTSGYRIGGKTGTAQKALNGGYAESAKICSFVASLPVDKPRYVVLVVVDEPQGDDAFGSTVAVPVAKKIIDGLLVLEKIPPSTAQKNLNLSKS